jgi:tellurite methyltransferase
MSDAERSKWNARYAEHGGSREPSALVTSLDDALPRRGKALDVAGGTGRHAIWLARRGLTVTLADISEVALEIAKREAIFEGAQIETRSIDFEADPFPPGPWDLILCFHYLWRPLFTIAPSALAPGGILVVVHPTRSNLERHARPGPAFLLEDGELPKLVQGLTIVRLEEGWLSEGRHEARLIARRPDPAE